MKAKLIIGCSETDSDLYYATRFLAPDDFIYLEAGRKKIVYINDMEFSRARQEAQVDEVINIFSRPKRYENVLSWIVSERKITEVSVPKNLAVIYGQGLERSGVKIEVESGEFFPQRVVKNQKEIGHIKAVQRINEKAMALAIGILRKSTTRKDGKLKYGNRIITSEFLKEVIGIEFLKNGCRSETDIVSSAGQSAQPHNCGSGPLWAHKPIVIDLYPRSLKTRYHADMTRTVVRGKASEEIKKIYATVLDAQKSAINNIRSGIKISSLESEVRSGFEKAGYETDFAGKVPQGFIHSLGHGVGLDIHESPSVSMKNKSRLKAGSVITIEPGLYYPDIGGVRIEDMIVVKKDGYENLTKFAKYLEI